MSKQDILQDAVNGASTPVYLQTRAEVVEYYQDVYGSKWKSQIVSDLVERTGKSRATVAREFQYDARTGQERYKNEKVSRGNAEKYQGLGQELPIKNRIPNSDTLTVTIKGTQAIYKHGKATGGSRERTVTATFSGPDAYNFVNNPTYVDIYDAWGADDPDMFDDGEYEIEVASVTIG